MRANALLLLYEPRALYKNRKYFLRQGSNILGSGAHCQVRVIGSTLPEQCADIRISGSLLSVVRLSDKVKVEVESNLYRAARCQLKPGVQYIVPPSKEFYIGEWRALFEAQSAADLERLNNVENKELFSGDGMNDTEKEESDDQKTLILPDLNQGPTQIIPELCDSDGPTQIIHQQCNDGPTQLIPDRLGQSHMEDDMLPTLILPDQHAQDNTRTQLLDDEHNKPKAAVVPSSVRLVNHNQSAPELLAEQSSMPPTLMQESSMPATLQQDQSYTGMATHAITEDPKRAFLSVQEEGNRMLRTMPITNAPVRPQPEPFVRKHQSEVPKRKNLEDLFDDFQEKFENGDKNNSLSLSMEGESTGILKRKVLIPDKIQPVQLFPASLPPVMEKKESASKSQQKDKEKRIAFSGFQPTEMQKLIIGKKKLTVAADDDYDTLIVGDDVRVTHRLLKALILGKEILSQTYINNGSGRILVKVFGALWEDIIKRPRKQLFEGQHIYISDALREYRELVELVGGTIVATLQKKLSKLTIKAVLCDKDQDLYHDYGRYKNWRFFSERALQQAIVLAEDLTKPDITTSFFS